MLEINSKLCNYITVYFILVTRAPRHQCTHGHTLPITSTSGFLSSFVADQATVGSSKCPWRIQAPKGKILTLSIHETNSITTLIVGNFIIFQSLFSILLSKNVFSLSF